MVKSETRRDAATLVRNPSPRLFGKKFRDSKKVKTNHAKTRLRDLSKTFPRFRDPVKIFRDLRLSRYHSPPLLECVELHAKQSHQCVMHFTRGGRVLPVVSNTAGKGYQFQASGIWKGSDFTCWSTRREICHSGGKKAQKGYHANRYILWLWKSRENILVLWFIHILKTLHLQESKILNYCRGMWKGYHLSIEGIRNGYLFREKWYIKG